MTDCKTESCGRQASSLQVGREVGSRHRIGRALCSQARSEGRAPGAIEAGAERRLCRHRQRRRHPVRRRGGDHLHLPRCAVEDEGQGGEGDASAGHRHPAEGGQRRGLKGEPGPRCADLVPRATLNGLAFSRGLFPATKIEEIRSRFTPYDVCRYPLIVCIIYQSMRFDRERISDAFQWSAIVNPWRRILDGIRIFFNKLESIPSRYFSLLVAATVVLTVIKPDEIVLFTRNTVSFMLEEPLILLALAIASTYALRILIYFRDESKLFGPADFGDQIDRNVSSRIEQFERRIQDEADRRIDRRFEEIVSGSVETTNDAIARILSERLDIGVVDAVQAAVGRQLDVAAKEARRWRHIEATFERIRLKLDGPASRAEKAAIQFRNAAMAICLFGLLLACYRLWGEGEFLNQLLLILASQNPTSAWILVFAKAAPWVGVILLAEFTALLFFRAYLRAIELQRYFTRELATIEARFAALRVVLDLGSPEQQFEIAKSLMVAEANSLTAEAVGSDPTAIASFVTAISTAAKDLKPSSGSAG